MSTSERQLSATESDVSRSQIMKAEIGPALTRLLRPIYDPSFSPDEEQHATPITDFQDLQTFDRNIVGLLKSRWLQQDKDDSPDYKLICAKAKSVSRQSMGRQVFSYETPYAISEGITSGVVVPLTVAAQAYRVESDTARTGRHIHADSLPVDARNLIPIMKRTSFADILQRLTRGPNGFLGFPSATPEFERLAFFEFARPGLAKPHRSLLITEAFQMKDGEVVGLSQAYHVSAASRRRRTIENYKIRNALHGSDKPYYMSSSGCPVRHEFKDEQGEPQEPLILTANKFLIAALEISARKSTGKTKPAERV